MSTEKTKTEDNDMPPLEEVKPKTEDNDMPPLEEVKGDDMPPLEEVKGKGGEEIDDDMPPLEEVQGKGEPGDDDIPPLEEVTGAPQKGEERTEKDIPGGVTGANVNYPDMLSAAQAAAGQPQIPGLKSQSKRSRSEKKAKKAFLKNHSNLTLVKDVTRVVIKQNKLLFIFENPEVYKTAKRFYVIFGEAKIRDITNEKREDLSNRILENTQKIEEEMNKKKEKEKKEKEEKEKLGGDEKKDKEKPDEKGDDEDDSGDESDVSIGEISEKDIEVVMEQANTTRKKALKALKKSEGDIVDAVMQLQQS